MKCPYCGRGEIYVIDSRPIEHNGRRRRYRCYSCDQRFTTYEYEIEQFSKELNEKAEIRAREKFGKKIVEYINNELSR